MQDNYDKWNKIKKDINEEKKYRNFKEKEIFYLKMGENIGFEQNGKGQNFVRPIVIIKKFNKDMFFAIPLSSKIKDGVFYHKFDFKKNNNTSVNIALLSQMKLYSSKRLLNKIGMVKQSDFLQIKLKLKKLIN